MLKRMLAASLAAVAVALVAQAEPDDSYGQDMHMQHQDGAAMQDGRSLIHYPEMLRIHTLANMRDHLLALGEIQAALADGAFDKAAEIAEQRLGMTSLERHGAHEVAAHMPETMRDMGTAMHRAASRFAVAAEDAAVNGDVRPALAALAQVTQACTACHDRFRLQ